MTTTSASETVGAHVAEALAEVKPHLRGWLHAAMAPLALAAGAVLVWQSPSGAPRIGSAIFAVCALVLFSVSAAMHRGRWSARTQVLLTRLDHACIFLLIAGSYTPFTLLLLHGTDRVVLLGVAWSGAALGIAVPAALPVGATMGVHPDLHRAGLGGGVLRRRLRRYAVPGVVVLLALGGLLYTVGGVVYGLRRPNPLPRWFGFHEVFHLFTVVAFAAHYAGVSIATYSLR